jgi:integrase
LLPVASNMLPTAGDTDMAEQRKALTKRVVEAICPCPERQLFLWDAKVPGFGLRILPSGRRSYIFQYRTKSRQQRRIVLGVHGPLTTDIARGMAADMYEAVRKGGDPVDQQKIVAGRERDTVEYIVDQFMEKYLKQKKRSQSYTVATRRLFDNHVLPRWRARDIKSITRRDVIDLLDKLVEHKKPVAANRTLAAVRKLFNWALQRGIVDATPVALVEMPGEETRRERVLSVAEIQRLWPQFHSLAYPFGSFFKMVLATGQRRDEVAKMRWKDIDDKERTWTLPSEMTKSARAHIVPLSPLAMKILAEAKEGSTLLPADRDEDDAAKAKPAPYVFTTRGDRPISGYSKAKARLDEAVAKVRGDAAQNSPEPWTIHDLRRTVGTGLGRLGMSRFIISRILNHADRSVTGIYDQYDYLTEKRAALEGWGAYLVNIATLSDAGVAPPQGAAR